ncbi:MAG TPA: 5'-3' exonuclease H3TH domain-containing protein [Polyangiaceae bacterium]|nr:5'-3' exonuclease H3TH domain-containing protein [Polyangiaceae bacterium]
MKRLHLVDGTFELFRAHFSPRPPGPLKATIGLAASMLYLLHEREEEVTHAAIAFDNPIRSVRNEWFDGYKGDEGVPPELRAQFDAAEEAARAVGLVVWSMDRYEADDAIATGAARWRDEVDQVRMLTPDKDLGQSIRGSKVVQVDRIRKRVIDEDELLRARGIRPASVPDWIALVGDTADGIPGIPGFGAKTAAALLRTFGRIEDIPLRSSAWPADVRGAERLAATLRDRMTDALFYRKLATLIEDVPLKEERLDDVAWRGVPRAAFDAWCTAVAARDLAQKTWRWTD